MTEVEGGAVDDAADLRAQPSGGVLTLVAMAVMTVGTYGYLIITAKAVGPAVYGGFAAIMNVLAVLNVAALALQATAARRVAAEPDRRSALESSIWQLTLRVACGLTLLTLVATPLTERALGLESIATAALVGLSVFPLTVVGGQLGVLQGEREWRRLAVVYLVGGLSRLVVGAALLAWRPTEFMAVLAVFVSLWAPVVVAWWFGRGRAMVAEDVESPRGLLAESAHNVQALLAFLVLSNIDILLAGWVLTDHSAGLYAAGMMLGRTMLVLSHAVATISFPNLSGDHTRRRALGLGLGAVLGGGAIAVVATWLLPGVALVFAGGEEYAETRSVLWRFVLLGTVSAAVQFLIYALIAMRVRHAIALTWIALVAMVGLCLPARTVDGVLAAVTVVNVGLLVVLALMAWATIRDTSTAAGPSVPVAEPRVPA